MRGVLRLAAATAAGLALAVGGTARAAVGEGSPGGLYAGGHALPVVASALDVDISGPFVQATMVQRFKNPLGQATEAVYVFPLPDDASVSSMVIRVGDRRIVARIEARDAARRRYEAAVAAGVEGALLEQERDDVFTQAVTAIPPGGEVTVELSWDAAVTRRRGRWQLAVPLVVGPRVVPGHATGAPTRGTGWAPDTDRVPDASRVTPEARGAGVPTSVRIHLDATGAIDHLEVPSHDADVKTHGTSADVSVAAPHGDRDLIVRWRTTGDRPAAMTDAAGFVALVVPAGAPRRGAAHRLDCRRRHLEEPDRRRHHPGPPRGARARRPDPRPRSDRDPRRRRPPRGRAGRRSQRGPGADLDRPGAARAGPPIWPRRCERPGPRRAATAPRSCWSATA